MNEQWTGWLKRHVCATNKIDNWNTFQFSFSSFAVLCHSTKGWIKLCAGRACARRSARRVDSIMRAGHSNKKTECADGNSLGSVIVAGGCRCARQSSPRQCSSVESNVCENSISINSRYAHCAHCTLWLGSMLECHTKWGWEECVISSLDFVSHSGWIKGKTILMHCSALFKLYQKLSRRGVRFLV